MKSDNLAAIREQAKQEIDEELFREAVEKYKQKLRRKKWYHVLFPFKIVILRRD